MLSKVSVMSSGNLITHSKVLHMCLQRFSLVERLLSNCNIGAKKLITLENCYTKMEYRFFRKLIGHEFSAISFVCANGGVF